MATKKFIEVQEFSDEELKNELAETVKQAAKLKFDHALKGLDNPNVLRVIKRDVARLKTEVSRRALQS